MCQIKPTKIYGKCQRNTHIKPESMPILLETVRLSVKKCVKCEKKEFKKIFLDYFFRTRRGRKWNKHFPSV